MPMLTHSIVLILEECILSKDKQVFVLKDSASNRWTLKITSSLLNDFFYHPWNYSKQTWPVINGYLPNKMKLMNYLNGVKIFQINISTKHLMTKKLFVIKCPLMIAIHNGNLSWPTPWFGLHSIGSMPCLDTLVLIACMLRYKPDTTIHISACTLNALCVMNVSTLKPQAPATGYSKIGISQVLLGKKLQSILLAHGQCQHHMVLWNSLSSPALIPLLILSKLQESSKNLVTILLPVLSTPGSLGIIDWCKLPWQWGRVHKVWFQTAIMIFEHQTGSNNKQKLAG